MTKKGFLVGLFLLGISVTALAKHNETVKRESVATKLLIGNNISEKNDVGDQSGGGNTNSSGTVLIPIKPPKPPVILK